MASTKRSSSLEYIELIPTSTPPPLDSSVSSTSTTIQRESQITDQAERLEGEKLHQDDSDPQQLDQGSTMPPGAAGGTAAAGAGGGTKEGASSTSR